MHLIETYALNCGLKIEKPHIKIEEIELPSKKSLMSPLIIVPES